jgi:outer membrane protein
MFRRPSGQPSAHAGLWLLCLPASPLIPPQQEPQESETAPRVLQLTLEDALALAVRNNLDLQIEHLATDAAHHDAVGSWGAFDPVLTVTGSGSQTDSQQTNAFAGASVVEDDDLRLNSSLSIPFRTGATLDLSFDHTNAETNSRFATFDVSTTDILTAALTQPLLKGAWRRYTTSDQRTLEILLEVQREREREIRARTLLDVSNGYWDLVSAEEELAVREVAVELGNQQLAQDQRRLEVGAGTEVDVLQSETNVAQQEELRLQADYALRQARDTLRRMLAPKPRGSYDEYLDAWDWPIETLTELPDSAAALFIDWRASLQSAIDRRPELAQRRLNIETAEITLQRSRSERLPRLDLNLSTSGRGFSADPDEAFDIAAGWDFPSHAASLTFSMPIFNRTASNAERSARSSLRGSRLQYERAELDVLLEVRTAVNEVGRQREAVTAAIKSRSLAQRQLEAEETRQQVGLSTTFQVLEFQEDLAQALSTEVTAKASHAKAQANLSFVEGRLGWDVEAPETEAR